MADEVIRRATRAITDLRKLAAILNDAGYPGDAIRLHGFAGLLKELEGELVDAQTKVDASVLYKSESGDNYIAATCIATNSDRLISTPATREETAELCSGNRAG